MGLNVFCCYAAVLVAFVVVLPSAAAEVNRFSLPTDCHVYRRPGDLILGGMFTIARRSSFSCNFTDDEISLGMLLPEAMAFALDEINKRDDLLPNISLGFEIWDSGWNEDVAVGVALSFINDSLDKDSERLIPRGKVIGIVGPDSSAASLIVSKITQPYTLPVVSHWATSNELSNKARFPFFFRAVPPDKLQAGAIVDLLLHFGWDYIALVYTVDSYGLHGARQLVTRAERGGVCIAMSAPLSELDTERDLDNIVHTLRSLNSVRVVVVFAAGSHPYKFLKRVSKSPFPYKMTWIASDGWGYALREYGQEELVAGGIFVRLNNQKQPEFETYLNSVDPRESNATGYWFKRYWKKNLALNCSEQDPVKSCSRQMHDGFSAEFNVAGVLDATRIFAHGLHSLLMETYSQVGRQANCTLFSEHIDGTALRKHMLQANFAGATGQVHLNQNGDPEGLYVLQNFQYVGGRYRFVDVGFWDSRKPINRLWLDIKKIHWSATGEISSFEVPLSSCRKTCSIGYIVVPLKQKCCWGCLRCEDNAIVEGNNTCSPCLRTHWPNAARNTCIAIVPTTVSLADPLIASIFALTCLEVLLLCFIIAGMIHYRNSRLVKATSRELSSINLVGLSTGCLVVILLLQPPTNLSCAATEALVSICFTLTYAPTLLKVVRIYRIFTAGRRMTRPPKFVGPKHQVIMAGVLVTLQFDDISDFPANSGFVLQLVSVVLVEFINPARPVLLFDSPLSQRIQRYCSFSPAFPGFCAYNLLIVLLCSYFAFRARKVPDNYNESKFIGFTVYSSLVLALAAVPVYMTALEARQKVAVLSMAIVANSFLMMFFVYVPKLFAVRFWAGSGQVGETTAVTSFSADRSEMPNRSVLVPVVS